MYIDPNNIRFDQKDIFVYLNQNWIKTNAIYSDENGLFIPVNDWICGVCHRENKRQMFECEYCHSRRERQ